ncbi:DUF4403 domain-containing protein [Chryseotalea sanaruensis]|uniref:DUF4403 domain-containing protein n=1 Tax=Chryseotalea sanaruensis TaxID=2482724 RepID=A0A401UAJ2_9BACT|nr:DUF4403 domain-containing protein [Chryseotalea sanaruensis]
MDSLEEIINNKITGTFVKQWIEVNENHDSLYIELTKKSKIKIRWINNSLHYSFPLHLEGKFIKHIGKNIRLKNETPVALEVVLDMVTQLSFANDWSLNSSTKLKQVIWKKEPVLRVAFININLRKRLDKFLEENNGVLTSIVDREISNVIDTKAILEKLWLDIQKPIIINNIKQVVWLKHSAQDLAVNLLQDGKYLGLDVRLLTNVRVVADSIDMPATTQILPPYQHLSEKKDSIEIFLLASTSFDLINRILNEELKGKVISSNGYSTTIKGVNTYATDDGLAVKLDVRGDADGSIYMRGRPSYDTLNATLSIKDFDFDVDSENALLHSADWLLHEDALKFVEEEFSLNLSPILAALPEVIQNATEKGKSADKLELFLTSLDVQPQQLLLTKNNVQLLLKVKGKAVIGLQKEVFAKKKQKTR